MTQPDSSGEVTRRVGGLHVVETALAGGRSHVRRILTDPRRRDARLRRVLAQARKAEIPVENASARELDAWLDDSRHQGIVAEIAGSGILNEAELTAHIAQLAHAPFLLALDGVQDPHNLGACLRSAEAAGADAVIIPRDRAARRTPVVERAAAGAADRIPLAAVTNLARTLQQLKEQNCWVIGATGEADGSLYEADLTGPLVLVCGGEGSGLRRRTRDLCDVLVRIPMAGRTESLNVSVAAAVCLFEALRQRRVGAPL